MPRFARGRLVVEARIAEGNDGLGVGSAVAGVEHLLRIAQALDGGTADYQIDRVWSGAGSIVSGTPVDIDLTALDSLIGGTISIAEAVIILIRNTSALGAAALRVGGDANKVNITADATDLVRVDPQGCALFYSPAGIAITNASSDIIQLQAVSGTVAYEVLIAGRSA
jgi:hypothetical protein